MWSIWLDRDSIVVEAVLSDSEAKDTFSPDLVIEILKDDFRVLGPYLPSGREFDVIEFSCDTDSG